MRLLILALLCFASCKSTQGGKLKAVGSEKVVIGDSLKNALVIVHVSSSPKGDFVETYACTNYKDESLRPKLISEVKESKHCKLLNIAPLDFVQKYLTTVPQATKDQLAQYKDRQAKLESALVELESFNISIVAKTVQKDAINKDLLALKFDIKYAQSAIDKQAANQIDLNMYRADVIAWNLIIDDESKKVASILQATAIYNNDVHGRFRTLAGNGAVAEHYLTKLATLTEFNKIKCPDQMFGFHYDQKSVEDFATFNLDLSRVMISHKISRALSDKSGCEFNFNVKVCDVYDGKHHCREENSKHCYEVNHPGIFGLNTKSQEVSEGLFRKLCS